MSKWDVFISHAKEDKEDFVDSLVHALYEKGIPIWYDSEQLKPGFSIRRGIDQGLKNSKYAIVILSEAYFRKEWTKKELDYLFSRDSDGMRRIFPVLHKIDVETVREKAPLLADTVACHSNEGIEAVVHTLVDAIREVENHLVPVESNNSVHIADNLYDCILHKKIDYARLLKGKRILIVDDEPLMLSLLETYFEQKRIPAILLVAQNGVEALEVLDAQESIDFVLTDKRMPRMDGFKLKNEIKLTHPSLPVALMTAHWTGHEKTNDRVWEFAACFSKPFDIDHLFIGIADILQNDNLYAHCASFRQPGYIYHFLSKCRSVAQRFINLYDATEDLFESALRSMIKDFVYESCMSFKEHSNPVELSKNLYKRLSKLEKLMGDIRYGARKGLGNILDGLKIDVLESWPSIEVSVTVSPNVPRSLSEDLETFLTFCVFEFVGNSLESMQHCIQGKIVIKMRLMQARNAVFLSVWNSGPLIASEYLDHIFTEGFSTRGPARGMGLCILKRMADYYNGEVNVIQKDGVQFSVTIPLSENNRRIL